MCLSAGRVSPLRKGRPGSARQLWQLHLSRPACSQRSRPRCCCAGRRCRRASSPPTERPSPTDSLSPGLLGVAGGLSSHLTRDVGAGVGQGPPTQPSSLAAWTHFTASFSDCGRRRRCEPCTPAMADTAAGHLSLPPLLAACRRGQGRHDRVGGLHVFFSFAGSARQLWQLHLSRPACSQRSRPRLRPASGTCLSGSNLLWTRGRVSAQPSSSQPSAATPHAPRAHLFH